MTPEQPDRAGRPLLTSPGYPAYVPLPGDPHDYLSQVPAGQGLSLGQMATTLRGAGMVVTQDHVEPSEEEMEAALDAYEALLPEGQPSQRKQMSTIAAQFTPSARVKFEVTIGQIEQGQPYPLCPRCRGERLISVCTDPGGDYRPSQWEYVNCPCCLATGEASAENAVEFIDRWQESQ